MAPSRSMSSHHVTRLIVFTIVQQAWCQIDDASSESRKLAVVPTMPPRPVTLPTCDDPLTLSGTKKSGYEPLCPKGYFKCCSTCSGAVCFSGKGLEMSWRGIPECVKCMPGDYCEGCDIYKRCPLSEIPGRKGPKITAAGSTRRQDCEICPSGYEADLDRSRCVKKWTHVCSSKYVARCVRNCRAEDPKRMKDLTYCEKMKCQLYCAKMWSDDCVKAFQPECQYRKDGPTEYDLYPGDEEWLTECNVDCSGAVGLRSLALLWCIVSACLIFHGTWL